MRISGFLREEKNERTYYHRALGEPDGWTCAELKSSNVCGSLGPAVDEQLFALQREIARAYETGCFDAIGDLVEIIGSQLPKRERTVALPEL